MSTTDEVKIENPNGKDKAKQAKVKKVKQPVEAVQILHLTQGCLCP